MRKYDEIIENYKWAKSELEELYFCLEGDSLSNALLHARNIKRAAEEMDAQLRKQKSKQDAKD